MDLIRPSLLRLRQCLALILGALHLPYDLIEDAKRMFIGTHNKTLQTIGDYALWSFSVSRCSGARRPAGDFAHEKPCTKATATYAQPVSFVRFLIKRRKRQNAAKASTISLVIVILALAVQQALYSFTQNFGPPKRALKRAFKPGR
jgi:hypothetical protein